MYAAMYQAPLAVFEAILAENVDVNRLNDKNESVMHHYLKDNDRIDHAVVKAILLAKFDHQKLLNEELRALIAQDIQWFVSFIRLKIL